MQYECLLFTLEVNKELLKRMKEWKNEIKRELNVALGEDIVAVVRKKE